MPRQIPDAQVLSAAIATMAQHGYAGATTRQIAETAGINEVTLFRRFGTKAKLLRSALLAEVEGLTAEPLTYSGDLHADLVQIVTVYQDFVGRRGRLIPIVLAEASRHPELQEVLEVPRTIFARVGRLLSRYQGEGALIREPPMRAIASLLAPLLMPAITGPHLAEASLPPIDPAAYVRAYLHGRQPASPRGPSS